MKKSVFTALTRRSKVQPVLLSEEVTHKFITGVKIMPGVKTVKTIPGHATLECSYDVTQQYSYNGNEYSVRSHRTAKHAAPISDVKPMNMQVDGENYTVFITSN